MSMPHHATIVRSVCPCDYLVTRKPEMEQVFVVLETFGIDDARRLIERAYQRPQELSLQQLIVQTNFITHEAQNALLKVLEEPPLSTSFLFVVSPDLVLLPTLLSRFEQSTTLIEAEEVDQEFSVFLALSYGERIAAIESALKKKDVVWQRAMKRGLIHYVGHQRDIALRDLEYVARLLLTRGASNKMLFEHMALTLPLS